MDPAQRHALILRAWEAVNAERDLRGVLDAVTRILKPVVHFDSLTIVSFDTPEHRLIAYNLSGLSALEGETMEELMRRAGWNPPPVPFERPLIPYPKVDWKVTSPAQATCGNLLEKQGWYAHEFKLAAGGVRAYTGCHLIVRGECIGVAVYCRLEPVAFAPEELSVLADVSKAMAIAAANAGRQRGDRAATRSVGGREYRAKNATRPGAVVRGYCWRFSALAEGVGRH